MSEHEANSEEWIEDLHDVFSFLREIKGLSKEQAFAELALKLTDPNFVKYMTNVTAEEAEAISEEFVIAQRYKHARHIADYALEELILRCSIQGWRARQHENIVIEGKRAEKVGFLSKLKQKIAGKSEGIEFEERRPEF